MCLFFGLFNAMLSLFLFLANIAGLNKVKEKITE